MNIVKPKKLFFILLLAALFIIILFIFSLFNKNQPLPSATNKAEQTNNMPQQKIIRPAAVSGSWYPGTKAELREMINGFLDQAELPAATRLPRILFAPHAGYPYSGPVAAYSFKALAGANYKKAIILGPSHNFPVSGLYLSGATHWETPLGLVKLADINSELAKLPGFTVDDKVHEPEHSLEMEVPFLQTVLPEIEIVPIIVGQLNVSQQTELARVLAQYLTEDTVLIVSVDLSHYHPYKDAVALDQQSISDILELDNQGILADEIDAPWAVGAVLELAKAQSYQPQLLKYLNSGDVTGDKSKVVGYGAVGFFGTKEQENKRTKKQDEYSDAEKKELLRVARTTIEMYLKEGKTYQPKTDNPKFLEKRGVFVTLNKNGQLRGCVGYIEPIKPLIEAVADNVISAAVHDNRFLPVDQSEVRDLEIEISVLTVPQADTLANIIKNKSGVVLQKGNRGATYLPQVWEDLPDADQFFSSLCLKGGLAVDCYRDAGAA